MDCNLCMRSCAVCLCSKFPIMSVVNSDHEVWSVTLCKCPCCASIASFAYKTLVTSGSWSMVALLFISCIHFCMVCAFYWNIGKLGLQ